MKKWCSFFLAALLITLGSSAFAGAEGLNALGVAAILTDEAIFYSGSVDGEEEGIFSMNLDGGGATKIYPSPDALLAYQDGHILTYSLEEDRGYVLDGQGAVVSSVEMPYGPAIGGNGHFYAGNLEIDAATGAVREVFPIDGEDIFWMITPVAVDDEYLYYLDQRQVGDNAAQYEYCASLWRISLTDESLDQIMDSGVKYIGMDDRYIYLERLNFWYYDDEIGEEVETSFETGLFRVEKDGSEAKKLCDTGGVSEDVYVSYDILKDGVLYGFKRNYSDEAKENQSIVSISADGQANEDVAVEEDALSVVLDDAFVLSSLVFIEAEEYVQKDELIYLNRADGNKVVLNPNESSALFYTEAEPLVAVHGDAVYYLAYDSANQSEAFFKAALDGSGVTKLAVGYIYPEEEDMP